MKALTVTALLFALSAVALAKPNPVERPRFALENADMTMASVGAMRENIGPVGAMRVPQDAPSSIVPLFNPPTQRNDRAGLTGLLMALLESRLGVDCCELIFSAS